MNPGRTAPSLAQRLPPPLRVPLALSLALALLAACGGDGGGESSRPPLGAPIQATRNAWTWVDFPDSSCGDGSPTGIGLSPGDSPNLLVFLEGGGACWTAATCFKPGFISTPGPYGAAEFQAGQAGFTGVLDRGDAANPFRDWSIVYVPYCTGDVHTGTKVTSYPDPAGGAARSFSHVGHLNLVAFLKRVAATFPSPGKLVVSGTSAGGFGALANYDTFRSYWPQTASYLVDDSGPALLDVGHAQTDLFDVSWGLYGTLDGLCPECRTDPGQGWAALARKYPRDRASLLSYVHDTTIPSFFLVSGATFTSALLDTAHAAMDPHPNTKYFLVPGSGHTLLRRPATPAYTLDGVGLYEFLSQQVNDSGAWASHAAAP